MFKDVEEKRKKDYRKAKEKERQQQWELERQNRYPIVRWSEESLNRINKMKFSIIAKAALWSTISISVMASEHYSSEAPENLLTHTEISGKPAIQSCVPVSNGELDAVKETTATKIANIRLSAILVEKSNGAQISYSEQINQGKYQASSTEKVRGYAAAQDYSYRNLSLDGQNYICAYVFK